MLLGFLFEETNSPIFAVIGTLVSSNESWCINGNTQAKQKLEETVKQKYKTSVAQIKTKEMKTDRKQILKCNVRRRGRGRRGRGRRRRKEEAVV